MIFLLGISLGSLIIAAGIIAVSLLDEDDENY
jgi:hypothetical protein